VDFNALMTAVNTEQQKVDPHFTLIGPDRIHPGKVGHLVMAYEFLRTQKPSGVASRIEIDASAGKTGSLVNCDVRDLNLQGNTISFTCEEKSLPFPVEDGARQALGFVPFQQDFNQQILRVSGLPAGDYELAIDGQDIHHVYSAKDLEEGVNLANESNTPQMQQSFRVKAALEKKWNAATKLRTIALCEYSAWPEGEHPLDASQMQEKLDAWAKKMSHIPALVNYAKQYPDIKAKEEDLRAQVQSAVEEARGIAQPTPHQFTIKPKAS
jgi:hypothetical protein